MRLFSLLSLISLGSSQVPQYFVNNNEQASVTIQCGDDSGAKIADKGLYFVQWFSQKVDPKTGRPYGKEEKIIEARSDPADPLTFETKFFEASRTDGSLTISPEDGLVGVNDQAIFRCRLTLSDQKTVIDDKTLLVMAILPSENEIEPNIIDDSAKKDYVFEENFPGTLATCEAGHAKPDAKVKWVVHGKDGSELQDVTGGTNVLESNPIIIDHDDDDTANSIELQLTLWNDQKKQGLGRDLDQTYYMCEVTYEKAVDGKLVPVQYSARFPEDDNKFVRVQHDVQNVRVLLNQQEVVGDYIDFSYYIEKDQGLPLISCDSDGFDPAGDNIVNGPDKKAIQSAVQAIREGKSNKLRVECSAENGLNKKPVEVIKNFDVKYIGSIDVEEYPGLIKSMPVEYKITVPTSGDDAEVLLYPYSTDPLDGQDFGSKADAEKAAAILANSGIKPIIVNCNKGKCVYKGKDLGNYYVVASIPGTDVVKVQQQEASTTRSGAVMQTSQSLPIKGSFNKEAGALDDPNKILFWWNKGSEDECEWERLTDGIEDKSTADKVARELSNPLGGQYIVCYDLDDVAAYIHNGGNYQARMQEVWDHNEPYCEFYNTEKLSRGSLWWLWVIIIIILLIVIAAIVWWIKQKRDNAAEADEEDPKLTADQTQAATNADDEFETVQDSGEKQPMLNDASNGSD